MTSEIQLWLRAKTYLQQSIETKQRFADQCIEPILRAAAAIAESLNRGGKLLLCGNGGSAADCQHISAEFVSTLNHQCKRPGLKAIALTTDTSFLTAYANDFGFEGIFARQVDTLGSPEDILIGISTSGNSKNVIAAIEAAKKNHMLTIALTGKGGRLVDLADLVIAVPSTTTSHIQESHITVGHVLCDLVECILFGETMRGLAN